MEFWSKIQLLSRQLTTIAQEILDQVEDDQGIDGIVDDGIDEEEEMEDEYDGSMAGGKDGRRGPDFHWEDHQEFESKEHFDVSEIPAELKTNFFCKIW